ncbi:MAG: hypothetical protein ACK45H_06775 [Bacteroidota bacterium]|jgi:hypothetical protein
MRREFLFYAIFIIPSLLFGQKANVQWGQLENSAGRMISVIPKDGNDFYALRWNGGALMGSYKVSYHQELSQVSSGKLQMTVEKTMANFETVTYVAGKLVVFLSDRKEGRNTLYMQEYGDDLAAKGEAQKVASYELEKGHSKGFFEVIRSQDKQFFGVIWEIPGKKEERDIYGFKIYDSEMNLVSDGEYKLPYEGQLSTIHQHYLSNTGDYFISLAEYKEGDRKAQKSFSNYKAMHIFQITSEGIEDFALNLEGKRVEAMSISSDNNKVFTITGIYGDEDRAGVSGLFFMRCDFNKREVIDEGFEKFGKDFITQDWTDRDREKAEKRESKGKGEPQLYNYVMRQTEVLQDGSIVGSLEQFYIREVTNYNPQMRTYTTTFYYYYNDIIAYKVGPDGGFEWLKKINKYQVSLNDGGPYSSYARFIDDGNLCLLFNDHVMNYDENGQFLNSDRTYAANFGKKKNVVAMVRIDLESGTTTRETFFDRTEITALAVPKLCNVDYRQGRVLLYAIYGKKERFGLMNISGY